MGGVARPSRLRDKWPVSVVHVPIRSYLWDRTAKAGKRTLIKRVEMTFPSPIKGLAVGFLLIATACTVPSEPVEIFDPYERTNRKVHAVNRGLDRALVRPTSTAYGTVVPDPIRRGVTNVAGNIDAPRRVVNDVLQGDIEDAVHNTFRFATNTILGIFGIFDVATEFGLENRPSDFGETLHVWGAPEGAYIELPLLGPSTERDAAGKVVDLFTNPLTLVLDGNDRLIPPAASAMAGLDTRYRLRSAIDSVYYQSADSYAQARNLYLQNRRFRLNDQNDDFSFDPYEDFDGDLQ